MAKTILIADDESTIRKLNSMIVEREFPDYNIELFEDGKELDERLNQNLEEVCLIVTDNQMPGMYGLEIIEKYARKLKNIPFVLYYGGDEEIGKDAVKNGAYDYVMKGNYDKLENILGKVLN